MSTTCSFSKVFRAAIYLVSQRACSTLLPSGLSVTIAVAATERPIVVGVARIAALEPSRFAVWTVTAAAGGGVLGEQAEGIGEFVWGVEGVGVAVEGLWVADGRRSRQRIDAREAPVRRVVVRPVRIGSDSDWVLPFRILHSEFRIPHSTCLSRNPCNPSASHRRPRSRSPKPRAHAAPTPPLRQTP